MRDVLVGDYLRSRGLTRRGLLKFCAAAASWMALPPTLAQEIAAALEKARRPSVIWLPFQECTGCTESITRADSSTLESLIFEAISLDYQHTLQAAAGEAAEEARRRAMQDNWGKYLVVVDGSIPLGNPGYSTIAGVSNADMLREVAEGAGMPLAPGRDEAIDERCGRIFAEMNRHPAVLPGAGDLLARLDAAGIPWAIATSSRREQVAASVDALRLTRAPLIVDGTHVAHAKPAPDLLLLTASHLNADPASCWYVGDATWDMLACIAAGMPAIGVTTGAVDAAALLAAGATRVVASLAEIAV